jgi:hypothetical protein
MLLTKMFAGVPGNTLDWDNYRIWRAAVTAPPVSIGSIPDNVTQFIAVGLYPRWFCPLAKTGGVVTNKVDLPS